MFSHHTENKEVQHRNAVPVKTEMTMQLKQMIGMMGLNKGL
jgi:hypothetical protein